MRLNLALALFLPFSAACTEPVETTPAAEPPEEVVVFPAEAQAQQGENQVVPPRTIADAPSRCDEEPALPHRPLPTSLRVSRDRRSLARVVIDANAIRVMPAESVDSAALAELRALIRQAEREDAVTYRYVRRPDRGGNGSENCLATTTRQSPKFALAFALYLRSYDFRWRWDAADEPR